MRKKEKKKGKETDCAEAFLCKMVEVFHGDLVDLSYW